MDKITMVSAIIAAVAAFLNLWLTFFERRDSIYIKNGSHTAIATPAVGLYVVNIGKHPVYLSDFGFIEPNGKLFSIPWYQANEALDSAMDEYAYHIGSTTVAPHDLFSVGITFKSEIAGVYAITSTQKILRVNMLKSKLIPKVFWCYLKAKLRPRYY